MARRGLLAGACLVSLASALTVNNTLVGFGNCEPFCNRHKMRALLPSFLKTYENKPWPENKCGCMINHCMAAFMVAAMSRATTIFENGVNGGMSGYLFRAAQPSSTVYHIDPLDHPICDPDRQRWRDHGDAVYMTGSTFTDFNEVDWSNKGIDKKSSLVFFDSHQPDAHIVADAIQKGFPTFLLDDNYPAVDPESDDMHGLSLKTVFAKNKSETQKLSRLLDFYYEMPPLINPVDAPKRLQRKYPAVFQMNFANSINNKSVTPCNPYHDRCILRIDAQDKALGLTQSPLLDLHDKEDTAIFEGIMSSGHVQPEEFWWYNHMAVLGAKRRFWMKPHGSA